MTKNELSKLIGIAIQKLRAEKGISLEEFAIKCKMTLHRAKKAEEGTARLRITDIDLIAGCFDMSIDTFVKFANLNCKLS